MLPRGWGKWGIVSVGEDENILEMHSGDGYTTMSMYLMSFQNGQSGKYRVMSISPQ